MARPPADKPVTSGRAAPRRANGADRVETASEAHPADAQDQAEPQDAVVFTSFDGTVRGVGGLPPDLGRATALANEKAARKIWGTPEEDAACLAMRKGI